MKKVVFIGSRPNVLEHLLNDIELEVVKVYILANSLLDKNINKISTDKEKIISVFTIQDKAKVLDEISCLNFDLLISNGCPFIFPVNKMKKNGQLYINVHPTLLPDLKGKTPLNGVFLTHRTAIGATMHYIDEGIDTGNIIAQKQVQLTSDIDQGLVYKISFDLEGDVVEEGMQHLRDNNYLFKGAKQAGEGSYFNRSEELQLVDITKDTTETTMAKIKSFNIRGQGVKMRLEDVFYTIYSAEEIVNPYLLSRYGGTEKLGIIFKYDNKLIVKLLDGIIKLTDYEAAQ